jgi:hypothetical protein
MNIIWSFLKYSYKYKSLNFHTKVILIWFNIKFIDSLKINNLKFYNMIKFNFSNFWKEMKLFHLHIIILNYILLIFHFNHNIFINLVPILIFLVTILKIFIEFKIIEKILQNIFYFVIHCKNYLLKWFNNLNQITFFWKGIFRRFLLLILFQIQTKIISVLPFFNLSFNLQIYLLLKYKIEKIFKIFIFK